MFASTRWITTVLMMLALLGGQGLASAGEKNNTILSITVEGNRNVEREAVLAKMKTRVGQQLSRRQLSKDVRKLYKAGFFSDIRFEGIRSAAGIKLICHVKEYPLIAKLRMEGNDKFTLKDLQMKMKLKPGRIFSPSSQQSDRNTLRKGYLKEGYYQVSIDYIPTERKDGRVDVLIRVHEGQVTHIKRIYLIGNQVFEDGVLLKEIASRQSDAITWFTDKDVFDQKRFGADGQLLQQYYLNHGYMDMKIESSQITISEDKSNFSLTFSIHEGAQYRVSSVAIQGDLVPDKATLEALLTLDGGDIYSLEKMRHTIQALTERIGDEGYAFASVTPLLKRNIDDHTVAITFDIEKGEEVYIERIEISGNEKTQDTVVRRMLEQSEGARYSGSQIATSKKSLRRAPYVGDVRISYPKASAVDKVKMKVALTEKKTGSFAGGIGFSQVEKVIITARVSEDNLLGKGYQVNVNGQIGKVTQNINARLTDPYFMGSNITASVNAFKTKTNSFNTVTYQTNTSGGGIGFGIPITNELRYNINYNLNRTDLFNVPVGASLALRAQAGRQTIGEVTQSMTYDSRDLIAATTSGHLDTVYLGVAGLGGQSKFWEAAAGSQWYFPFGEESQFVLNPSISGSMIRGYGGKDLPLWRRYSLGGIGSLRGFDSYGVSVRDPVTGEAIGGDKKAQASVNFFFPLPYMRTSGMRGAVFVDAGSVWGNISITDPLLIAAPLKINEPFALSRVRYTAGFGIEWLSPIGPVALAWSFPLKTLPGDVQKTFEFAIGGSF